MCVGAWFFAYLVSEEEGGERGLNRGGGGEI